MEISETNVEALIDILSATNTQLQEIATQWSDQYAIYVAAQDEDATQLDELAAQYESQWTEAIQNANAQAADLLEQLSDLEGSEFDQGALDESLSEFNQRIGELEELVSDLTDAGNEVSDFYLDMETEPEYEPTPNQRIWADIRQTSLVISSMNIGNAPNGSFVEISLTADGENSLQINAVNGSIEGMENVVLTEEALYVFKVRYGQLSYYAPRTIELSTNDQEDDEEGEEGDEEEDEEGEEGEEGEEEEDDEEEDDEES